MIITKEIIFPLIDFELKLDIVNNVDDLITDPTDEDKIPTWAELWPSARALASYICTNGTLERKNVLELGTGLGIPGLTCGMKGAKVTFTDFIPEALELVKNNAIKNNIKDFKTLLADWRTFPKKKMFDIIIGSDIFYNPKLNPYIFNIFNVCLETRGELLLAHPGRPDSFSLMQQLKSELKFKEEKRVFPITIDDPYFPYYNIYIHHLYKNRLA